MLNILVLVQEFRFERREGDKDDEWCESRFSLFCFVLFSFFLAKTYGLWTWHLGFVLIWVDNYKWTICIRIPITDVKNLIN